MKCRKATKLIQRMLDGELSESSERAVRDHVATCGSCAQYYQDMAVICHSAHVADPPVPSSFRAQWQRAIVDVQPSTAKRELRPSKMVPALAGGVAGVIVLSIAVANPQALGLGGENLRSQVGAVTSAAEPTVSSDRRAPIVFREIVSPSQAPKPATQNAEFWEETVWSSSTPSQVVIGDIESPEDEGVDSAVEAEASSFEGADDEAWEITALGAATVSSMKTYAENLEGVTVWEDDGIYVEGDIENIAMFLTAFELDAPEGTTKVHVIWEEAE